MFHWKKLGRVFDPASHQRIWLSEFGQAPATLILEDRLRVFFACRPPRDRDNLYVSYTAFADFDLKDPTKLLQVADSPVLNLGDRGCFDEHGTYPLSVIQENDSLRAFYAGWSRCESVPYTVAIGSARSHDNGSTFVKNGPGPVLAISTTDPYLVSGPKIRRFNDKFYLFYISTVRWELDAGRAESIYKIRVATSDDGETWFRSGKNLISDVLDLNECQASPDVLFMNGKYHMFFSYKYGLNFRGNGRGYRIGYAVSGDLVNWSRDDSKAGIQPGGECWEDQSIAYPHVFCLKKKVFMLYNGNDVGKHGFGIAELKNAKTI